MNDHSNGSGPGRSLAGFRGDGYDKGRGRVVQACWLLISGAVVMRWWCPNSVRISVLRMFGSRIGPGVSIRHRVRIHWPWKLTVVADTWIGEGAWILNLEPVVIGQDTCVSQEVLLCTGSHDRNSPTFEFDNAPIVLGDGVWIGTRATVLRGVIVHDNAVVGATTLVHRDVPAGAVLKAPL